MSTTWLQFDLAGSVYALPLGVVTEVTAARRPHLIPLVPLAVGGVLNVRGEPLPAVDGCVLLGGSTDTDARHALILGEGGARIGVLVESVSRIERGLEEAGPDESGEVPTDSPGFVRWVRHQGARIGLLDEQGLLEAATARLIGPLGARGDSGLQSKVGSTGEETCRNAF